MFQVVATAVKNKQFHCLLCVFSGTLDLQRRKFEKVNLDRQFSTALL
jgi:hypothetical protein